MTIEKKDFDKAAASWDQKPERVKLANDVANAILTQISLTRDMDVLEFGCGTGLLTLRLQPLVHSMTGVDSSQGMLAVLREKIKRDSLSNIKTQCLDLDSGHELTGRYQLIVSSMTFHHISEIKPLLEQFYNVSAPGGYLCIADLDLDDGQFHGENDGAFHDGFDRHVLRNAFMAAGFYDVCDTTAAELTKPVSTGTMRRFTVFLMTGKKK